MDRLVQFLSKPGTLNDDVSTDDPAPPLRSKTPHSDDISRGAERFAEKKICFGTVSGIHISSQDYELELDLIAEDRVLAPASALDYGHQLQCGDQVQVFYEINNEDEDGDDSDATVRFLSEIQT